MAVMANRLTVKSPAWTSAGTPSSLLLRCLGISLIVGTLSGCSVTNPSTSESIPLSKEAISASYQCTRLKETGDAQVYSCLEWSEHGGARSEPTTNDPLFVTVLRDCSISEKFSHQATTRQLLIGFTDLKILSQEPIDMGPEKVLRSVVSGTLDVDPVYVSTFTLKRGSCVTDLVMWKQSDEANSAVVGTLGNNTVAQKFSESSTLLAQSFAQQDVFPSLPQQPGALPQQHGALSQQPSAPAQQQSVETHAQPFPSSALTAVPDEVKHAELPTG
jgi:hypothetical protein